MSRTFLLAALVASLSFLDGSTSFAKETPSKEKSAKVKNKPTTPKPEATPPVAIPKPKDAPSPKGEPVAPTEPFKPAMVQPRLPDGSGQVVVTGELKQWHKATLTLDGPFAHEQDVEPNAFTDYAVSVVFRHDSGSPIYTVPGYFAADGNAAETGAVSGTKWRAHFAPDRTGVWHYTIHFGTGKDSSIGEPSKPLPPYDGIVGRIRVDASSKSGRDFRAHGRLGYVGERFLRFAGTQARFVKLGADSPEDWLKLF